MKIAALSDALPALGGSIENFTFLRRGSKYSAHGVEFDGRPHSPSMAQAVLADIRVCHRQCRSQDTKNLFSLERGVFNVPRQAQGALLSESGEFSVYPSMSAESAVI